MIRLFCLLVLGAAVCAFTAPSAPVVAAEGKGKEVELKGTVCCGKCELKESEKCAVTIVAKDKDGKKVTYWFDAKASKKYHSDVCEETKEGTVKGTVTKDGDKMVITVSDLKYK